MKKVISLLVVLVLSTLTTNAQLITQYTFGASTATETALPSFVDYTVLQSASAVNTGSGQTAGFAGTNFPASGRSRFAQNWTTSSSINLAQYFNLTLVKDSWSNVTVSQIYFQEARSDSGPRTMQIRTSLDGFTSVVWQGNIPGAIGSPGPSTWRAWSIPTSLNLPTSIEIRFYAFAGEHPQGAWRIDNLRIYGNVTNLPIELISFTALPESTSVRLNWTTASELNNDYFTVLRSTNPSSESWEEVARVQGAGTSQMSLDYEAFDNNPLNGISYYKLRQTDFDGTFSESPVVAVNFNQDRTRSLVLRIGNMAFLEGQTSYLIDASGKILGNQKVHTLMQAGTYFLKGEDGRVLRLLVLE